MYSTRIFSLHGSGQWTQHDAAKQWNDLPA